MPRTWSASSVAFSSGNQAAHLQVAFSGVAGMTLSDPAGSNEHLFTATPVVGTLIVNGAGNDSIQATAPVGGTDTWRLTGQRSGNDYTGAGGIERGAAVSR